MFTVEELEGKLGMELDSFMWVGPKVDIRNAGRYIQGEGFEGEVYCRKEGLLTRTEYFKVTLEKGFGILIDGKLIAKKGSVQFTILERANKARIQHSEEYYSGRIKYPVKNEDVRCVFDAVVRLYEQGLFDLEKLIEKINAYILPSERERVIAMFE